MSNFLSELKTLKIDVRNKVRAIIYSDINESVKVMNSLRRSLSGRELANVERVIRSSPLSKEMLPELFPESPQLIDSYNRLCNLPIAKNLEKIDFLIDSNYDKLVSFFKSVDRINDSILNKDIKISDFLLKRCIDDFGYNNFMLRKAVFLHIYEEDTPEATEYVNLCGIRKSLINSLLYCFEEEQDYLSIKKTAISIDRERNEYVRDMLRCTFLPIETDTESLSSMLQSSIQSSLIDSIILLKINSIFLDLNKYKNIISLLGLIKGDRSVFLKLLEFYDEYEYPETVFFNRSSAWLELDDIASYRLLMDHYYDDKDANYINIDESLINKVSSFVLSEKPEDILNANSIYDICIEFDHFIKNGLLTKSAIFNFIMSNNKGRFKVSEETFKKLMERTTSLSRFMGVSDLKSLALLSGSVYVEIVVYLLIIKRNEDEFDNFYLRGIIQQEILNNYNGDVVAFVKGFSDGSEAIGNYLYDVFNEGFLSVLSEVVKRSEDVTNLRAKLHHWMGDLSGDNNYYEKANNLLVDHRINLVRDELDDHRIYVDTSKFIQWMQDEMSKDLSTSLLLISSDSIENGEFQLKELISKCFEEFYSNNIFGVASYLGRRLRHGTFKGFLYSDTINEVEKRYERNINNSDLNQKWEGFKFLFEKEVDKVVKNNLHIKSNSKRDAFLDPNIAGSQKDIVMSLAIKNIRENFDINGSLYNTIVLINECCWRFSEIDMKSSVQKLKDIRGNILGLEFFNQNRKKVPDEIWKLDFFKDLHNIINEKFSTIYGWFNKPHSVSPKASLGLLYKAVVEEVKDTYSDFKVDTDFYKEDDIEMMGGAYHNIYDALYVIIFNAAKHSKNSESLERSFSLESDDKGNYIHVRISSEIKDEENESEILKRIEFNNVDIDEAQTIENRSGIPKLYNLEKFDSKFKVKKIFCDERKFISEFSYELG